MKPPAAIILTTTWLELETTERTNSLISSKLLSLNYLLDGYVFAIVNHVTSTEQ
jgi:hypothetical protein